LPAHRHATGLAAIAALAVATLAAPAARAQECDFSPITQFITNLVATTPQVPGAGLRLAKGEDVLYEQYFGSYTAATVVPIASATKMLSAATVMTLVDDGLLDLDAPVSASLPAFTGSKGTMTLRQMFSHTSGLPGANLHPVLATSVVSLAAAVDEIACCVALAAPPATQFAYGGLSMHVGGRMAEVASGQLWDALFAQRIAVPLGMTHTDYEGLGPTNNPRMDAGARSSLDDYGRFLEMLLGGGVFRGARILEQASVEEMRKDQTFGVPIVSSPALDGTRYGLGTWRNVVDGEGEPVRVSSPGAFGFTPWLELDLGYYGVFLVAWSSQQLRDEIHQIQALARAEIAACTASAPPAVVATSAAGRAALVFALAAVSFAAIRAGRSSRVSRL
jgi:CubicO group peptidase (beta-lactamase class C family)